MKPVIYYVDDEPHNLTVFETSLPDDWQIVTFDNPVKGLEALDKHDPWVIVCDQRMPGMTGVQFLEIAKKIKPNAIRIIVTGYSDEDLVVQSVRKAEVFDYIKKPWDMEDLEAALNRASGLFKANREARLLQEQLIRREIALETQNRELKEITGELERSNQREQALRAELECWVPPFVLKTVRDQIQFPVHRDLVGITYDIIGSGTLHGILVQGRPLRSVVMHAFSELLLKYGGWRESHSGDSAYGHFGLLDDKSNPFEAALAVAREFRVAIKNICDVNNVRFECGIALHLMRQCVVDIHKVQIHTGGTPIIQKSFDTNSADIDLLHRMEKFIHSLPGSNIIMSAEFVQGLRTKPGALVDLGPIKVDPNQRELSLLLIKSDLVNETHLSGLSKHTKKAA